MPKEGPPYNEQPITAEERAQVEDAAREATEQLESLKARVDASELGLESADWKDVLDAYAGVQKSLHAYAEAKRSNTKRFQTLINTYYKRLDVFNDACETVMEKMNATPKVSSSNAEEIEKRRAKLETLNEKERRTKGGSMDHDRHEKEALALEEEIRGLEKGESERKAEESRKEEIQAIRKRLATLNEKERRTKGGSMDHDRHEKQVLALEEELRSLERKGRGETDAEEAETDTVAPVAAQEKVDRSAASPLEVLDEELRRLYEQFSAGETTAKDRAKMKQLMELRDRLLGTPASRAEEQTIEYDQIPEFTGNQDALDAIDQLQDSVEEEPLELTEKVMPEAAPAPAPRDPMGPDKDGKDIVMLNSVLTRQAMGAEKRTKKNAEKMKKFGTFPADPRYGGVDGAASAEVPVAAPTPTRAERLAAKQKKDTKNKRRWLLGGAGVLGAAGLLALFNPFGKKVETTAVKQPERPAAARTAEQAGLKTPLVTGVWDTPPAVTVPAKPEAVQAPAAKQEAAPKAKVSAAESRVRARVDKALERAVAAGNISDADAQMVMAWEHMAYEKARQALPPGSDTRITSVVETIRANRDNPYAFSSEATAEQPVEDTRPEAAPAAPEAVAEKPATVQNFMYGAKGKETLLLVSSESEEAFARAREYAKTLPANEVVRFEAVKIDPVTRVAEPLRGAFMSLGDGRTSPLLRDPETGKPFTAPDPSLMSRARRGGEAAGGR